jgi:hypothetical protein
MKRVLVLVEGQTEERFMKDVLCPHLWGREIDVTPKIATTKRVKRGPDFKGGITDYQKVENDVRRLLSDTDAAAVTTFIDYYGLPSDFPGMASRPSGNPIPRAVHVETTWASRIAHERFHPYLMVHEFEALLFSKPEELGTALHRPALGRDLAQIRASFSTPEEINDNPETAPSRRIIKSSPAYQKAVHGPTVAKRIGLQVIREQCAHFNAWLDWLESL